MLFRYVGKMRLAALRKLTRAFAPPTGQQCFYPLEKIQDLLMFEDEEDCLDFLEGCALEVTSEPMDAQPAGPLYMGAFLLP